MDNILVVGGGDFARKVIRLIHRIGSFNVVGYTDITNRGQLFDAKYLGNDDEIPDLIDQYPGIGAVLSIVGDGDFSSIRKRMIHRLCTLELHFPILVAPSAFVEEDATIEQGTIIFDNAFVDFGVTIGRFSVINVGAIICHDAEIASNVMVSLNSVITGGCKIGHDTSIGTGVTINPYLNVANDSVIGSGAVVVRDCTSSGTYVGAPARIVSK